MKRHRNKFALQKYLIKGMRCLVCENNRFTEVRGRIGYFKCMNDGCGHEFYAHQALYVKCVCNSLDHTPIGNMEFQCNDCGEIYDAYNKVFPNLLSKEEEEKPAPQPLIEGVECFVVSEHGSVSTVQIIAASAQEERKTSSFADHFRNVVKNFKRL